MSLQNKQLKYEGNRRPHYGIRKLSIGAVSVLLSTTLYLGLNTHGVFADQKGVTPQTEEVAKPAASSEQTQTASDAAKKSPAEQAKAAGQANASQKKTVQAKAAVASKACTASNESEKQQIQTNKQETNTVTFNVQKNTKLSPKMLAANAVEATGDDSGISVDNDEGFIYYSYNAYKKAYADGTLPKLTSGTYPDPDINKNPDFWTKKTGIILTIENPDGTQETKDLRVTSYRSFYIKKDKTNGTYSYTETNPGETLWINSPDKNAKTNGGGEEAVIKPINKDDIKKPGYTATVTLANQIANTGQKTDYNLEAATISGTGVVTPNTQYSGLWDELSSQQSAIDIGAIYNVKVTYTPDPNSKKSVTINYVDTDANNKTVSTGSAQGAVGQTITITPTIPANYVIDETTPITYKVTSAASQTVTIKLKHQTTQNSVNKTVTRIINVTDPHTKQTKTTTQTAQLTQTTTLDKVTGKSKTSSTVTNNGWTEYDVPAIDGYTPSQKVVSAVTPDGNTSDQTVNVTYIPNKQTTNIIYKDEKGNIVKTDTVNGLTDQTVNTNSKVLAGWQISNSSTVKKVPDTITFTGASTPDTTIIIEHKTVTVTPDSPKTTDDTLPDNPNKKYPSGVGQSDLNKTVTRTINVTDPTTGKTTTSTQTVTFTRTATVDEVDGTVKSYGDWSENGKHQFAQVTVPSYPGYQANVEGSTAAETVTPDSGDQTVNITYSDKTVTVTPDQPKTTDDTLPDNPNKKYPSGVSQSDLNKTVTRTINVTDPHTGLKTTTQTAKLTRTATVDEVTGDVTYGNWTTGSFDEYDVPVVPGYSRTQDKVAQESVNSDSDNETVNISYTANDGTQTIKYVDNKGSQVGNSQVINGKTDQNVRVTAQVPAGWKVVDPTKVPTSVTIKSTDTPITIEVEHNTITVKPGNLLKPGDTKPGTTQKQPGDGKPNKDITYNDLHKAITRTVTITDPHSGKRTQTQTLNFERTGTIDDVTGDVTYSDWTPVGQTGSYTAVTVPDVAGYTKHVTNGDLSGYTPTQDQINNWTDPDIKVTYTPNNQATHIIYQDKDGKTVKTDTVNGQTDQTVATNSTVPAGWTIAGSSTVKKVPDTIKFTGASTPDTTIVVEHKAITVKPGDLPNPEDTKPGTTSKQPGDGKPNKDITYNDLHKAITRTVTINDPHRGEIDKTQTLNFERTGTIDDVTGDVTYSNWIPAGQTGSFTAVTIPDVAGYTKTVTKGDLSGYTPTQDQINNWNDPNIKATYTANPGTQTINYVDPKNNNKVIGSQVVPGTTDETVKVTPQVPTGWQIVEPKTVPATVKIPATDTPIRIPIEHKTVQVTPDSPRTTSDTLPDNPSKKYPSGVGATDLNKTVTRTINVIDPETGKTTTTKQTAKLTRTATVDEVDGTVKYSEWTLANNGWTKFTAPAVAGYTPNKAVVAAATPDGSSTDQTINISYTANPGTQTINYVDQKGKVIISQVIPGTVDETVKVTPQVPKGWRVVDPASVPTMVTIGVNDQPITVVVKQLPKANKPAKKHERTHKSRQHQTPQVNSQELTAEARKRALLKRQGQAATAVGAAQQTEGASSSSALAAANEQKSKALPQTSEHSGQKATLIGLALTALGLLDLFAFKKRRKEN